MAPRLRVSLRLRLPEVAPRASVALAGGVVLVVGAALRRPDWERALRQADRTVPHLIFDWSPGGALEVLEPAVALLRPVVTGPLKAALCPHGGGPPSCWCRPPLPGLPLAFARAHALDPARSVLIGTSAAHRSLAAALGARYVLVS